MRISDLKIFATAAAKEATSNWIFVKLYTDEGLTGVGEASLERHSSAVITAELCRSSRSGVFSLEGTLMRLS